MEKIISIMALFCLLFAMGCTELKLQFTSSVGEPDIFGIYTYDFNTEKRSSIAVMIRNIGQDTGMFGISANCTEPFRQIGDDLVTERLAPQKWQKVYVPIRVDSAESIFGTCTVTVYDMNDPSVLTTKNLAVSYMTHHTYCEPGIDSCWGEIHKVCKEDGSGWQETNSTMCQEPDDPDNDPNLYRILGIILVIVGLVITIVFNFPPGLLVSVIGVILIIVTNIGII